jgi:hypothetical protein
MRNKIKIHLSKKLDFELDLSFSLLRKKEGVISEKCPATLNKGNQKVFCIGLNKTGTTSLERTLRDFGFRMGDQSVAEILTEDWAHKRIDRILRYCHTADAFQDLPFSTPSLYRELDCAFLDSKFILSIRDSADQWYWSLVNSHTKLFSSEGVVPDEKCLDEAMYRYKGFALDMRKNFWNYPEVPLYDYDYYTEVYSKHIADVEAYFKGRSDCLLVLNLKDSSGFLKLCDFLDIQNPPYREFPWINKTD